MECAQILHLWPLPLSPSACKPFTRTVIPICNSCRWHRAGVITFYAQEPIVLIHPEGEHLVLFVVTSIITEDKVFGVLEEF